MRTDNNIEERLKTGAGGVNKIGIKKSKKGTKENEKKCDRKKRIEFRAKVEALRCLNERCKHKRLVVLQCRNTFELLLAFSNPTGNSLSSIHELQAPAVNFALTKRLHTRFYHDREITVKAEWKLGLVMFISNLTHCCC